MSRDRPSPGRETPRSDRVPPARTPVATCGDNRPRDCPRVPRRHPRGHLPRCEDTPPGARPRPCPRAHPHPEGTEPVTLTALLAIAAAAWWWHTHRPRHGAGASAAARARALRTPLVRLATALGIRTRAAALADRSDAGAAGERRTAARLAPLTHAGWRIFHDRALPTGRANVDHLAISPAGTVFLPDTKKWSADHPVLICAGRLLHGNEDVTGRLNGLRHETATVARVLGVPVTPLVVMDGPQLIGPHGRPATQLEFRGILIVPADRLTNHLTSRAHIPGQRRPADLAATITSDLPPYTRRYRG
ncbi:NERD domain-containing protein [Streptomyces albidoflavus]|nr:NERD domain-containing protein [Streptomyces albidoflavus]